MLLKRLIGAVKATFIIMFTFLIFPFARIFLWHKKIWIVSEYGYEARDNGFIFFKYIRERHPEINCYYAIDYKSSDYNKVKSFGNIINFGSFKHFLYFCAARYLISSKTQGFCPSYYLTLLRKKIHLWGKYVFLQHGITYNNQTMLYKKEAKLDLIICGAKPEFDEIVRTYGYSKNEVAYTGFARFDTYHNTKPLKQILVMPTWRRYDDKRDFINTDYYKIWDGFINSSELDLILSKYGYKLYFYLHPEFKEKRDYFSTNSKNIFLLRFENIDFQKFIRESEIYITDFSSLAFDFGYMCRPVIYFQYDKDFFYSNHYKKGYFDYEKDGFGPICNTFSSVFQCLSKILDDKVCGNKYILNSQRFFPLRDRFNCERIFMEINKIK